MRPDQIESEVMSLISFIDCIYASLGLSYRIELSTRPEEKYIGDLAIWEASEAALAAACKHAGKDYKVNPGDGAFYGPKLDFHIKDSLGREWQCGSIERFIGILIEHFAGHFPTWLAPQQVMVVPVHYEKHLSYAEKVNEMLVQNGFRSKLDARNEKLGYRIREAQLAKIPYQIVLGDGEEENGTVTIRRAQGKDSTTLPLDAFIAMLKEEVEEKRL